MFPGFQLKFLQNEMPIGVCPLTKCTQIYFNTANIDIYLFKQQHYILNKGTGISGHLIAASHLRLSDITVMYTCNISPHIPAVFIHYFLDLSGGVKPRNDRMI